MSENTNTEPLESPGSIFHNNLPVEKKLDAARMELLDLSMRNRLLNMPRSVKSARTIEVIDERSAEVFRLLVRENRAFTFVAGRAARMPAQADADSDSDEISDLAQPEDDGINDRGILNRHADTKLQTRLTSAGLQRRLLDLYNDARTLEEEQGVNILFLVLGTLKWIDPANASAIRYAPLILIPVNLERGNAAERFKLKWRQEEQASNLSLEAYLDRVHGLKLPPFEPGEDFSPTAYLDSVAEAISSKSGWEIVPDDIVLGFFSFAKFLMYRDLDPEHWPKEGKLTDLPLIQSLLSRGFKPAESMMSEDELIDRHISPQEMLHIVDSDSSQTLAVHDIRQGHNLVIQGPPGTGKSQTIANVIGSAIADGKTVLFVAEKMAALEVVKRRLDVAGVGDACLELHSNKANKRALLDELRRTWELGSPRGDFASSLTTRLLEVRDTLNDHAARMHKVHVPSSLTPYQVIGRLVRLRQDGQVPTDIKLEGPESWSDEERVYRESLVSELSQRVTEIGLPTEHPWWCVGLDIILPTDVERLVRRVADLRSRLNLVAASQAALGSLLEVPVAALRDLSQVVARANDIATAPECLGKSIAAPEWESHRQDLSTLLEIGSEHARVSGELAEKFLPTAWTTPVSEIRTTIAQLPSSFGPEAFDRSRALCLILPRLLIESSRLQAQLGIVGDTDTVASIERLVAIGERVAEAPAADPEAFNSNAWGHSVEQISDLVDAVEAYEWARAAVGTRVAESAWNVEFSSARQSLAAHGNSFLRHLNSDWRRANRLVKSVLTTPAMTCIETVTLLDSLIRGQIALKAIQNADTLGRSAFASHWRGEKSASAPLRAMATWVRSLSTMSAVVREIASRIKENALVGEQTSQTRKLLDQTHVLLNGIAHDFDSLGQSNTDQGPGIQRISLTSLITRLAEVTHADDVCRSTMIHVPSLLADRLLLLDTLIYGQQLADNVGRSENLGKKSFGPAWRGAKSDWSALRSAASWVDSHLGIRGLAARLPDHSGLAKQSQEVQRQLDAFLRDANDLCSYLRLDQSRLFGVQDLGELSARSLGSRFQLWVEYAEQLSRWVSYCERANRGRALGLGEIVDRLEDGRLSPSEAVRTFEMAYYEALFADQVRTEPALARFDGQLHGKHVRDFADLDRQRIATARLEIVRAHYRRIPQSTGVGPVAVLRTEMAKRRGHLPIRQLMHKAAPAVQALKPVIMMSPLSVAQFLPPGQLTFDLLVMDEASQIQPVDALGAIARCRQVVVVGDERQLPPTKFFARMTGSQPDNDDEDVTQVADVESILGLFIARGLPQRMLRWHYRSRHQSLIAVSNSQFYENKLFIVPSPYTKEAGMGLRFHYVSGGVFDSGVSRTNSVEAIRVAQAIIEHARQHPELSLGVATFSAKQRRAIQDQLELLRRANPDTEAFFNSHADEPFFVKNLENVQGDERDVIFISVGYGRNAQGTMAMAFGPLSRDGGERRLNVLISRAKRRCEVYASITDEDIDLERAKGRGVFAFKLFLHFARTGRIDLRELTGRTTDSVFENQVAAALQGLGYQVHPRVGIAGFFIDLAIADPERPGRYLLGIECDGPSYSSARSARDRDRLRQMVLEDHGWIIYRLWSTDWFQRPKEQLERLITAIVAARAELTARGEKVAAAGRAVPVDVVSIERDEVTEIGFSHVLEHGLLASVYAEAKVTPPGDGHDLHETPMGVLVDLVETVVKTEGPVHVDEVVARLRTAWGLQRSGARIQSCIERAISQAVHTQRISVSGRFLSIPGLTVTVRDRSRVASASLRKVDMLPPMEIKAAILQIVRPSLGATPEEIVHAVARLLGFKSTSAQLRDLIQSEVDESVREGRLVQRGLLLTANSQ